MELFSTPWWSALLAIVLIDLVLAGDNAIVIGMAAARVPQIIRRKVIFWGLVAAVRGGARGLELGVETIVCASLGLLVVVLKIFVH